MDSAAVYGPAVSKSMVGTAVDKDIRAPLDVGSRWVTMMTLDNRVQMSANLAVGIPIRTSFLQPTRHTQSLLQSLRVSLIRCDVNRLCSLLIVDR